ncbi:MAG: formate/nitrite transporter family protein [Burkholderiales bacterium]
MPSPTIFGSDAYASKEIAARIESMGVAKVHMDLAPTIMLGMVAGGFIGLGAMYYVLVASDSSLGFAASRVLGGLVFSLGLILVVIAGAELFTGNNLLVMAWADRKITSRELLRNWTLVYFANALGAVGLALIVYWSGHADMNNGAVGAQYVKIALSKVSLPFAEAFFKGVLCNLLVCLAVWLAMAGRSVTDKILAVVFPISAFVAAGFEHSVANMYLIPLGILLNGDAVAPVMGLGWSGLFNNLVPVTLGNIAGGSVLVALVYFVIYRRGKYNW